MCHRAMLGALCLFAAASVGISRTELVVGVNSQPTGGSRISKAASISLPRGIAVSRAGDIYFAAEGQSQVLKLTRQENWF
jgi:hypothetical protein